MSEMRHRREDYDEVERSRYRDRRRSRTPDRYYRRRYSSSRSRSRSRGRSPSRYHYSYSRDSRSSRYSARRHSVSRSRSRSCTRRDSRSGSRSRTRKHSRTPTKSHRRRSCSNERKTESQSKKRGNESRDKKQESPEGSKKREQQEKDEPGDNNPIEHLPLPAKKEAVGAYYDLSTEEPIDKEKIHREMEEKLRATLAKEGKIYPPPKPEASHPVFANDGSFIEIFKKMQQAQQQMPVGSKVGLKSVEAASTSTAAAYVAATSFGKPAPPPPIVGRRRGGKILKTGLVAKPKAQGEDNGDPKDFWTIYLREVNKYKNNACDSDTGTRPLVK